MIYTLEDFIREYRKIKEMGWIRTHRAGPTGVGKTLEDLLGIEENNHDAPDFGEYELKYGYSSSAYDNEEKVLHSTLTAAHFVPIADTGHQLKIVCDAQKISIASELGTENVYWEREKLRKAFEKKYKNKFVYAKAQSRGTGADEEFYFEEAYEVSGFDYDAMIELLEQGRIYIDLRIGQYANGKTHDHGTGFRIREIDQPKLFKINRKVV